jgi:hypothetical protein
LSKNIDRDDLVMEKDDRKPFFKENTTIGINQYFKFLEEKIDGANLGISINIENYKILAQNRSHYVKY